MIAEIEEAIETTLATLRPLHNVFNSNGWREDASYVDDVTEYLNDVLADPTYSDIEGSDMPESGFSHREDNYDDGGYHSDVWAEDPDDED